jgi:hypothetical protein
MNQVVESLFFGYAIYSLAYIMLRLFRTKGNILFSSNVDRTSAWVISLTGIIYLVLFASDAVQEQLNLVPDQSFSTSLSRATGPYWYGYLLFLFIFIVLPQLLWFRKIRQLVVLRIFMALAILFALSFEKFVIIITSIHRNSFSAEPEQASNWTYLIPSFGTIINWAIMLGIFSTAVFLLHLILNRKTLYIKP